MDPKRVTVIGGGVAGVCAALDLAALGIGVDLVEKGPQLGGHASRLSCKATDRCVQCGACLVHHRLARLRANSLITVHTGADVAAVKRQGGFTLTLSRPCPSNPEAGQRCQAVLQADAIVVATGFALFDPAPKPYGHGHLPNVITNLDLEATLRAHQRLARPSDGKVPAQMAFVQCVGSRDAAINHGWCSRFCCAATLRSAAWIAANHPDIGITIFYIDIQSAWPDAPADRLRDKIKMVRSIPGDVCLAKDGRLQVTYWDPEKRCGTCTDVDMVVLAAGMQPSADTATMARLLGVASPDWENGQWAVVPEPSAGVFWAGAVTGPATIADSVASAAAAAWQAARFLGWGW